MDVIECICTRRSVRKFMDKPISSETINNLVELATKAPTASNGQPWGFVLIDDTSVIDRLSEMVRADLLVQIENFPYLQRYERWFHNPDFHFFYHAPNLILIYGNSKSHFYVHDCSMAAQNIMLAAQSMGIGSCWIGFAQFTLNSESFKERYSVPQEYDLVSTLALGYKKDHLITYGNRKEPVVFNQKSDAI